MCAENHGSPGPRPGYGSQAAVPCTVLLGAFPGSDRNVALSLPHVPGEFSCVVPGYQLLLSSLFIAQLSLAALAAKPAAKSQPGLVPWPKTLTMGQELLTLGETTRVLADRQDLLPLAKVLSEEIHLATGRRLATGIDEPGPGDLVLAIDPALKGEAYTIEVKGLRRGEGRQLPKAWPSEPSPYCRP